MYTSKIDNRAVNEVRLEGVELLKKIEHTIAEHQNYQLSQGLTRFADEIPYEPINEVGIWKRKVDLRLGHVYQYVMRLSDKDSNVDPLGFMYDALKSLKDFEDGLDKVFDWTGLNEDQEDIELVYYVDGSVGVKGDDDRRIKSRSGFPKALLQTCFGGEEVTREFGRNDLPEIYMTKKINGSNGCLTNLYKNWSKSLGVSENTLKRLIKYDERGMFHISSQIKVQGRM